MASPLSVQPKRGAFPSAIPSARRSSTSSNRPELSVASSPSPSTNSPSGIPAFRSLRSLLPFGPNKHPAPVSSPSNHGRSPFANFGSVRRSMSMHRERKGPESAAAGELPVISIGRNSTALEEPAVRRSISYSDFEKDKPLPKDPPYLNENSDDDTILFSGIAPPMLRVLSPVPPISADLSTILEADISGISKHSDIPTTPPPGELSRVTEQSEESKVDLRVDPKTGEEADTSLLDLSTTHLRNQVLDAIMAEDSNTATRWSNADTAIIIDAEGSLVSSPARAGESSAADQSFNLGALDPDLAALLSPRRQPNSTENVKHLTIASPLPKGHPPVIDLSQQSPVYPQFKPSPSTSSAGFTGSPSSPMLSPGSASSSGSVKSIARSRLPTQQSSLPRLRPPTWHPPTATPLVTTTTTSVTSSGDDSERTSIIVNTAGRSSESFGTQTDATTHSYMHTPAPPSPLSISATTSTSSSTNANLPASIPPRRSVAAPQPRVFTPSTSRLSTAAIMTPKRPPLRQMISAPSSPPPTEWGEVEKEPTPSRPSSVSTHRRSGTAGTGTTSRPSIESTTRGSLDQHQRPFRPSLESSPIGSEKRIKPSSSISPSHSERPRPSLDIDNLTVPIRPSSRNREALLAATRTRKRSMSVQDRSRQNGQSSVSRLLSPLHQHTRSREEHAFEDMRSSSSLSGRFSSGKSLRGNGVERPPATEWLGPRTVKAFKAAGLMDFDREREREREPGGERPGSALGSNGLGLGLGLGSTLSKFGFGSGPSGRSASEYTPGTRAHSRMAFSEAGSGGGGSAERRGSGSGTLSSSYGLMESPTFTERDTPTTAPTSVGSGSASPFGFLGREREKEKEEIRELKEKHLTETGALLGALSDSQRTTKMLREENGKLRDSLDRLGDLETENEALRAAVGELRREVGELRVQLAKADTSVSRLGAWTARRSGLSTSISSANLSQKDEEIRRMSVDGKAGRGRDQDRFSPQHEPEREDDELEFDHTPHPHRHPFDNDPDHGGPTSSTPAPASKTHQRRFSTTSSIFPAPPANMTMLLHDSEDANSIRFSGSPTVSIKGQPTNGNHNHNNSIASISPTTANFSMVTGSPGSLFLRPEHEVHLGDMESLDLGVRSGSDGFMGNDDGW